MRASLLLGNMAPLGPVATLPNDNQMQQTSLQSLQLPLAGAATVALPLITHASAFQTLAQNLNLVLTSGATGDQLWAPIQFWFFFAALHPILQPAIAIGELLHASPGPLIGIIPASFIAVNVAALTLLAVKSRLRSAVNVLLFALFINYIGSGLEGIEGDYNLALDDGIKGCPTYEQVRQPSMDGFDVTKYTGRWYEHAFHDWTQFKEVYDTTFDIELSRDGVRWLDDFGIRGPSPESEPVSWDKSPVANGAHYFLRASIDESKPGLIEESGFGVTFPN